MELGQGSAVVSLPWACHLGTWAKFLAQGNKAYSQRIAKQWGHDDPQRKELLFCEEARVGSLGTRDLARIEASPWLKDWAKQQADLLAA